MSSAEKQPPKQHPSKLRRAQYLIEGFVREFQTKFKLSSQVATEITNLLLRFYELKAHIVIANGSTSIKAGFAGDEHPFSIFPSVVGKPKSDQLIIGSAMHGKEYLVGNEALAKRGILSLTYPIDQGQFDSTDDKVKLLWRHAFEEELRYIPEYEACNVLMTEPPLNPKAKREEATKVMFEELKVNGFYLALDAVLSLYASGRTTGIVFDLGDTVGHTVPIYEGYRSDYAILRLELAGREVTRYLMRLLTEKGYSFTTAAEQEIAQDIKKKLCYVADDYDAELEKAKTSNEMEKQYELPDGQMITVGVERFKAAECLFRPSLIGMEQQGNDAMLYLKGVTCHICMS